MIISKMTARKPWAIMMTTSMRILLGETRTYVLTLKLTSIAPTPMTQEMMIMLITKAATIARTVKKEEVMIAQQRLLKLCSHCTLKMLKEKVTPESVFFFHPQ